MKANLEKIKKLNDKQLLIDLKKAKRVWTHPPETNFLFYISKKEVMEVAEYRKVSYKMTTVSGELIMTIL